MVINSPSLFTHILSNSDGLISNAIPFVFCISFFLTMSLCVLIRLYVLFSSSWSGEALMLV